MAHNLADSVYGYLKMAKHAFDTVTGRAYLDKHVEPEFYDGDLGRTFLRAVIGAGGFVGAFAIGAATLPPVLPALAVAGVLAGGTLSALWAHSLYAVGKERAELRSIGALYDEPPEPKEPINEPRPLV